VVIFSICYVDIALEEQAKENLEAHLNRYGIGAQEQELTYG